MSPPVESSPAAHSDQLSDQLGWIGRRAATLRKSQISRRPWEVFRDASCVGCVSCESRRRDRVQQRPLSRSRAAKVSDPPIAIAVAAENEVTPVPPDRDGGRRETALAPVPPSEIVAAAQREAATLIPAPQTAIAVVEETALPS